VNWELGVVQDDLRESGPTESLIVPILYRPYDPRFTYYTGRSNGFIRRPQRNIARNLLRRDDGNYGLLTTRQTRDKWDVLVTDTIVGHKSLSAYDITSLFPLYIYPTNEEIASGLYTPQDRQANFSRDFVEAIELQLQMKYTGDGRGDLKSTVGPEDVFYYMYAVFHSDAYRDRYAELLKRDFPRVPITDDTELFQRLCEFGERLVSVHLLEVLSVEGPSYPVAGDDLVGRGYPKYVAPGKKPTGEKDPVTAGRVYVNSTQYFDGVPPEIWGSYVGGHQVCKKWLKDRQARTLDFADLRWYQGIVASLMESAGIIDEIEDTIEELGGWPLHGSVN